MIVVIRSVRMFYFWSEIRVFVFRFFEVCFIEVRKLCVRSDGSFSTKFITCVTKVTKYALYVLM